MDKAVARISPEAGKMEVLSGDRIRLTTEVWKGIYEIGDKVQIEIGGDIIDFRVIDMHFGDSIWEQITTFKRISMDNIREDKKQLKRELNKLITNFQDNHEGYVITSVDLNHVLEVGKGVRVNGVDITIEVQ